MLIDTTDINDTTWVTRHTVLTTHYMATVTAYLRDFVWFRLKPGRNDLVREVRSQGVRQLC